MMRERKQAIGHFPAGIEAVEETALVGKQRAIGQLCEYFGKQKKQSILLFEKEGLSRYYEGMEMSFKYQ